MRYRLAFLALVGTAAPALAAEPVPVPVPVTVPAPSSTLPPAPVRDPNRPPGFGWGDGRSSRGATAATPAVDQPYNWRQMAFGGAIMAAMLGFLVWLIRRNVHRT